MDAAAALVARDGDFEVAIEPGCSGGTCTPSLRYRPLHPDLFREEFRQEWLADTFRMAVADGSDGALLGSLREEVPGRVWSFDMLKPEVCGWVLDELENYERSGLPVNRPNSMNNYGVIVNQIGMRPLIDDLQRKCIGPLARLLFPVQGSKLTSHHSFMVQYKKGEDLGLDSAPDRIRSHHPCAALRRSAAQSLLLSGRWPLHMWQCTTTIPTSPLTCALGGSSPAPRSPSVAALAPRTTGSTCTRTPTRWGAGSSIWAHTGMAQTTSRAVSGSA